VNWRRFEHEWYAHACRALAALAEANPAERLYCAAFHLFYADGRKVLPPAFAANAETSVRIDAHGSTRFAPPEWRWDVIDEASAPMAGQYEALSAELVFGRHEADALLDDHDHAMARVCRALTTAARKGEIHRGLPVDFVAVILEGQRDPEAMRALVRASVDPQVLESLPELSELA
jgi:hypothetical protein